MTPRLRVVGIDEVSVRKLRVLQLVEGLHNKILAFRRRACGLRDDEYLQLNALTPMMPYIQNDLP